MIFDKKYNQDLRFAKQALQKFEEMLLEIEQKQDELLAELKEIYGVEIFYTKDKS